jgi:hypothetical protein
MHPVQRLGTLSGPTLPQLTPDEIGAGPQSAIERAKRCVLEQQDEARERLRWWVPCSISE